MARFNFALLSELALAMVIQSHALISYTPRGAIWDMMFPAEDPFRILEQTPLTVPKGAESLTLGRSDWKETATEHLITMDIPGMKKEDVKIEVEENRVLTVSGERKYEEEVEGDKWHRAERTTGKLWRQFILPVTADLEHIEARLGKGVLKITVPKLAEEKKQPKVVNISEETKTGDEETKTGDEETKTGDEEAKTGDEETRTGGEETRTGGEEVKTGDEEAKTGDEEAKTGGEETKTGGEDTKATKAEM